MAEIRVGKPDVKMDALAHTKGVKRHNPEVAQRHSADHTEPAIGLDEILGGTPSTGGRSMCSLVAVALGLGDRRGQWDRQVHELSIAEAIAHKVRQRAAGRTVSAVAIRVGHFRQVVPDALQFSWTMLTEATTLQGCRLEIEQVPATVQCQDCGTVTTLDVPILLCRSCDGANVSLLTGQEFMVVSLEIAEV